MVSSHRRDSRAIMGNRRPEHRHRAMGSLPGIKVATSSNILRAMDIRLSLRRIPPPV